MKPTLPTRLFAAFGLLLLAHPACAASGDWYRRSAHKNYSLNDSDFSTPPNWEVNVKHSELGFSGLLSGSFFHGTFPDFSARIAFDRENLWDSWVDVRVNTARVKMNVEAQQLHVVTEPWLNVTLFPTARFTSHDIREEDDGSYTAYGVLTLKGEMHAVPLHFTAHPEADGMRVEGTASLNRRDFFVGTGEWANEQWVRNTVEVSISLLAHRVGTKKRAEE